MENKDLQSKVNGLLGKLPGGFSAEIIEIDEQTAEPQRKSWKVRSFDDLESMLSRAAEEATKILKNDEQTKSQGEPGQGVPDAILAMIANAAKEAFGGTVIPISVGCYHYILNEQDQPVPCEDGKKIMEFQARNGHIVALESIGNMKVITTFKVHNAMIGNEPPPPRWQTELFKGGSDEAEICTEAMSAQGAMELHRVVCAQARREIEKMSEGNNG